MKHVEIIEKLVGEINPVGATHIDNDRLDNLKLMCEIVDDLVTKIDEVATDNANRHERSMREAGQYASNFLTNTLGITE